MKKCGAHLFAVCAIIAGLIAVQSSNAAEVECVSTLGTPLDKRLAQRRWPSGFYPDVGACWSGYLKGPIVPGDYQKVRDFMRAHHKTVGSFWLNSPGGNVLEAIEIGRLFRKYLISATAPSYVSLGEEVSFTHLRHPNGKDYLCSSEEAYGGDCSCVSACALIWLGAIERYGSAGFHRPRIVDPQFIDMPPAAASSAYRDILRMVELYMEEMEAPRTLKNTMISTSSTDIKWVERDDGLDQPPSIAEWLDAACRSVSQEEERISRELWAKEQAGEIQSRERMLKKFLDNKINDKFQCETLVLHNYRDALEPP